jgi:aspartate-semialdehyde dehydrogenase
VGTRFVLLLSQHPHLELVALGASARSSGKRYSDVARWKYSVPLPKNFADMMVRRCIPSDFPDCEIIFSGLDSDAGEAEIAFLKANFAVFSNAKNHRLDPLIPLVVPTANLGHTQLIPAQRRHFDLHKGLLICNSNCAVIGVVVPFAALQRLGSLDQVSVVTMQAMSGAGYPGISGKVLVIQMHSLNEMKLTIFRCRHF